MTQFAFVFPGQGSQSVGMLAEMAAAWPVIEETFGEASAALGYDLWALTQQGPAEELNKTWQTQPALLAASVALYRVWQQQGGKAPALLAGHSLGEYSALVCAGVIGFADAVRLVELRGKFMQEAVPEGTGAMSAIIGLDDAAIAKACEESAEGQVVSPVNYNSPGQVVIAGHKEAVERAGAACKAAGVTCIGYRKPGSGLVSVCFEGEISAIHTAIERGVAVAGAEHTVKSLVIARPERCVVEALSNLKGNPPREEKTDEPVVITAPEPFVPPAIPNEAEDKHPALKKGKKS